MAKESTDKTSATLGDVLYSKSKAPVPEQDWAALVQAIAAGDQLAPAIRAGGDMRFGRGNLARG